MENIFAFAITIRNVSLPEIPVIRQLIYQTWPETYKDILSKEQIGYMLDMIYSDASLTKQIMKDNHRFIIAYENNEPLALSDYSLIEPGIYKIHKIYVLPQSQGKGLGKLLINYIKKQIEPEQATALHLNVNRYNKARQFYEHLGFKVIAEEDIDIGSGYFMNDYIMELPLNT